MNKLIRHVDVGVRADEEPPVSVLEIDLIDGGDPVGCDESDRSGGDRFHAAGVAHGACPLEMTKVSLVVEFHLSRSPWNRNGDFRARTQHFASAHPCADC